jgi:hypothetical protein
MGVLLDNQFKFTLMVCKFIVWLYEQGYTVQFGDAYRNNDKLYVPAGKEGFEDDDKYSYQEILFYNKKTKLTYGKHNERLAVDLLIWKDNKQLTAEEYRPIGIYWESLGGRWGGRFGVKKDEYEFKIGWDSNHFEL